LLARLPLAEQDAGATGHEQDEHHCFVSRHQFLLLGCCARLLSPYARCLPRSHCEHDSDVTRTPFSVGTGHCQAKPQASRRGPTLDVEIPGFSLLSRGQRNGAHDSGPRLTANDARCLNPPADWRGLAGTSSHIPDSRSMRWLGFGFPGHWISGDRFDGQAVRSLTSFATGLTVGGFPGRFLTPANPRRFSPADFRTETSPSAHTRTACSGQLAACVLPLSHSGSNRTGQASRCP
jgi:hypothetical protein